MSVLLFSLSSILLLLTSNVFGTGTIGAIEEGALEIGNSIAVESIDRSVAASTDESVRLIAASDIESTSVIDDLLLACEVQNSDARSQSNKMVISVAQRAAVSISAVADRCTKRIEAIIGKLGVRLAATAGNAIVVADSTIKLATSGINIVADRTANEAQLIANTALSALEQGILSVSKLAVDIAQSNTNSIKLATDAAAQNVKLIARRLGGVQIATGV